MIRSREGKCDAIARSRRIMYVRVRACGASVGEMMRQKDRNGGGLKG